MEILVFDPDRRDLIKALIPGRFAYEAIKHGELSRGGKWNLLATLAVANILGVLACEPAKNPFMDKQLQKLGFEINGWKLRDGVSVVESFPEIGTAANLLEGKVDPRQYLPFLAVPVPFQPRPEGASFRFTADYDNGGRRKIIVTPNQGRKYSLPFVKYNCLGNIGFSSSVMASSLRLVVAAKEASQIVDHYKYCKVFRSLLEEQGEFVLENPDNIPTTEQEMTISIAWSQTQVYYQENYPLAGWFRDFVDIGSFIRVGSVAYANWHLEQKSKGIEPTGKDVIAGRNIAGFLQEKGLIKQKGQMFVWTAGKAPEIESQQFLDLFNEYTGRK